MFLFTKGTNEQSVPFKITAREQFMNILHMFIREDRKTVIFARKFDLNLAIKKPQDFVRI